METARSDAWEELTRFVAVRDALAGLDPDVVESLTDGLAELLVEARSAREPRPRVTWGGGWPTPHHRTGAAEVMVVARVGGLTLGWASSSCPTDAYGPHPAYTPAWRSHLANDGTQQAGTFAEAITALRDHLIAHGFDVDEIPEVPRGD